MDIQRFVSNNISQAELKPTFSDLELQTLFSCNLIRKSNTYHDVKAFFKLLVEK